MGNFVSESKETIINCPVHETAYNGICANRNCTEQTQLICNKCSPDACTISGNHELISLDEFYVRFFVKSSGSIDFQKLNKPIDELRKFDREILTKQIEQYNIYANKLIDEKLKHLNASFANRLEMFKKNVNNRIEKLQKEYLEAEARIDLPSFEIPENFSLEETKKFFEKNSKNVRDMENMINLVKKYSDNEKLQLNQKDMETIIFSKNLIDYNMKQTLEEKLELVMKDLKQGLDELIGIIVYNKESSSVLYTGVSRFNSSPKELTFKQDLSTQGQKSYTIDSVFTAYTTLDGVSFVAWANASFAIDVYELRSNKIAKSLTGHTQHVFIVRHFLGLNTDYLISTSYDKSCNVWNASTLSLTLAIPICHTGCYLYSALILFEDSKAYAVSTAPNEYTKVWEIPSGTFVKNVGTAFDYTYHINSWYDSKNNCNYIINANSSDVKMYDFKTGKLYKAFPSESSTWHMSALVHEIKEGPHLFETDGNGYLRIWNVVTGAIFKTIQAPGTNLRGLCLWNEQYLIAASSDKSFKVFDIISFELSTSISGHDNVLCSVEKVLHPLYGEVLISSAIDGKIKLWVNPQNK